MRLTLLDTCYLAAGFRRGARSHPAPLLRRHADAWAARDDALRDSERVRIGAAIHSVRAVPRDRLATVVAAATDRPLHVHLSEQPAENEACLARHGCTPTQLLAAEGALGTTTTAVHATHLTPADVELLGSARATACICPTTERDLADGIGPAPVARGRRGAVPGQRPARRDRHVRGGPRSRDGRAARVIAPRHASRRPSWSPR